MIHSEQQGWVRGVPKTIHIEILTSKIVNRSIMVMSIRMNHQPRVSPLGYAISTYWVKLTRPQSRKACVGVWLWHKNVVEAAQMSQVAYIQYNKCPHQPKLHQLTWMPLETLWCIGQGRLDDYSW